MALESEFKKQKFSVSMYILQNKFHKNNEKMFIFTKWVIFFISPNRKYTSMLSALYVLLLNLELWTAPPSPLHNFTFFWWMFLGLQSAVDKQVGKQASLEKDGKRAGQEYGTCWTEAQGRRLIRSPTRWRHHEARTSRTCSFGSTMLRKGLNT